MFQDVVYKERIATLKKKLEPNTLYLFSNPSHITYFTGFEFLVPNEREAFFVCDTHSSTLIHTNFAPIAPSDFLNYLSGSFPFQLQSHFEKLISNLLSKNSKNAGTQTQKPQLQYDAQTLFVAELDALKEVPNIETKAMLTTFVSDLMSKKDSAEISAISKACAISQEVFEIVQPKIVAGITEIEIAQMISDEFTKKGISELAFPTIVAFGANSAKPHHQPSGEKLEDNTVVLIDMGGKFEKYCADMTRTFWFGAKPSDEFKKIEKIVLEAYESAVSVAKSHAQKTVLAKDIDNAARSHISNKGFGDNFIHTTGHGLGLDIHELPSLSWRNFDSITTNMTITIEPGIYLEGNFGYRYENTVLFTETGCEILTKSTKK